EARKGLGGSNPPSSATKPQALLDLEASANLSGQRSLIPFIPMHELPAQRPAKPLGLWLNIWRSFLSELNERRQLQWSESFLDSSFALAKKETAEWAKPAGGKARSGWWWPTARVFLWETTVTLHPRRKSGSRRRRSKPSAYVDDIGRGARGRSQSG